MHGLKEAVKLAHDEIKAFLKPHGYESTKCTPGMWKHTPSGLTFTLIVNDLETKYTDINRAQHLLNTLQLKYEASTDWMGYLHAGVTLDWNYYKRTVKSLVPKHVQKMLEKHGHTLRNSNTHLAIQNQCNAERNNNQHQLTKRQL